MNLFASLPQPLKIAAAWLLRDVHVSPGAVGCFAVALLVLWIATMRHGNVEPPRCSDGE
jgi:hypothetical protein